MSRSIPHMPRLAVVFATAVVVTAMALPALATPAKLSQQGRLVDDSDSPLEGAHQLDFKLYDDSTGGEAVWSESRNLDVRDGYYATVLGDQTPLSDDLFADGVMWLELTVDGTVLTPRHQLVSVPTAFRASVAENLEGGIVDAAEIWVGGELVIDDQGNWVGSSGANSWDDLSDIPADLADGDTDTLGAMSCATGQVAQWDSVAGQWVCASDTDSLGDMSCASGQLAVYDSLSGQWVCGSDTDTLGDLGCFDGAIPAWSASFNVWTCASDQDTDSDTLAGLSCADGGVPVWDALLNQWTCALSSDTTLSESQVEAFVINGPLDLDAATTIGGQAPALLSDLTTALDWSAIQNVPADLVDGDDILTEAQVEGFITNAPIDLPAGSTINGDVIGAGANLGSNVTIGSVVPGDSYPSNDTPLVIPDDNAVGISSLRFVTGGATINNFSVDINIAHTEMGDLTITLYTPLQNGSPGPSVVLYDGELAGTANMVGNIARDFAVSGGTIYALYGLDSNGTWRLEVVDNATGNTGTLNSWALNINETWSGDLFVGNSITADGDITTTGNIEVIQGSDLIFKNTAGAETMRIDGDTGQILDGSGNLVTGANALAGEIYQTTSSSSSSNQRDVNCADSNDVLLGGGCEYNSTSRYMHESRPNGTNGWRCRWHASSHGSKRAHAICLSVP